MATLHKEIWTIPVSIIDDREVHAPEEEACSGIAFEPDEIVDMQAPVVRRNGIGGFQHSFDFCESRTDSATTVHTMEDLLAEAG